MLFKKLYLRVSCLLLASLVVSQSGHATDGHYKDHRVPFSVTVDGIENPYDLLSLFVMPNQVITLASKQPLSTSQSLTPLQATNKHNYTIVAPKHAGIHTIELKAAPHTETMTLQLFVMHPLDGTDKSGYLEEYKIGSYPDDIYRDLERYTPPKGLFKAEPEDFNQKVSPHFTLGQFLCKQSAQCDSRFLIIDTLLLQKLEGILTAINNQGIPTNSFSVLSGYRTPSYNHGLGNGKYSRHLWGDAADIYVDVSPKDGRMDDLNGDGKEDYHDAQWLYDLIEKYDKNTPGFAGGLGKYKANSAHGPFVHVDVRGYPARWGKW